MFKYYGPIPVTERMSGPAYRLQLPPDIRIHPIFHVSELKLALGLHC
jgi:hypothetical protein